MPALMGQMMQMPLMISSLIQHAARHSGSTEVVSKRVEGDVHRSTWGEIELRARDRHAREAQFRAYEHYLPFYWEQRTATVEVITGANTVLGYLVKPVFKTLSESLVER